MGMDMIDYPVHKEGDIEWSCVDATKIVVMPLPPSEPVPETVGLFRLRGVMTGPPDADLEGFLQDLSWFISGLKVTTEARRNIIRETVRYKLEGSAEKIQQAKEAIAIMIKERNRD